MTLTDLSTLLDASIKLKRIEVASKEALARLRARPTGVTDTEQELIDIIVLLSNVAGSLVQIILDEQKGTMQ